MKLPWFAELRKSNVASDPRNSFEPLSAAQVLERSPRQPSIVSSSDASPHAVAGSRARHGARPL